MRIADTTAQDAPRTGPLPRHRRNVLLALIAVTLLTAAGWVAGQWLSGTRSVDAARLRIATVTRGDLVRDVVAEGRVIAANSPNLYAIAAGTVELRVVAGTPVQAGDVLAVIDSPELRSRLIQEQASLASLDADAARAELDVQQARAEARKLLDEARIVQQAAQRDLERYQRAFAGGAVAQIEVARAEDGLDSALVGMTHAQRRAGLLGDSAALQARNQHALASRQRAVVTDLQRQVDALQLHAPFDGQVGQVLVGQHANVAANTALLTLVDATRFEVEIQVAESFARDLAIGMPAELTGDGMRHLATLAAVSPEVVNGEVTARLRFDADEHPPHLRQNQRLTARILLDSRKDVLTVTRGPDLEPSSTHAWVVRGDTALRVPVTPGAAGIDTIEVQHGLAEGDRVIVSGAGDFPDDQPIRIH